MGKTSLFPSLTLPTLDLKEVEGGSKVLHIKPSKFKCWSLASGCGGHCSREGESAGGGLYATGLFNRDPESYILALQVPPQNWGRCATLHRDCKQRCQDAGGAQDGGCPGHQWTWQRCSLVTSSIGSAWHTTQARCSLLPLPLKTEDFCSWSETKPPTCLPEWAPDGVLKVINFQAIV